MFVFHIFLSVFGRDVLFTKVVIVGRVVFRTRCVLSIVILGIFSIPEFLCIFVWTLCACVYQSFAIIPFLFSRYYHWFHMLRLGTLMRFNQEVWITNYVLFRMIFASCHVVLNRFMKTMSFQVSPNIAYYRKLLRTQYVHMNMDIERTKYVFIFINVITMLTITIELTRTSRQKNTIDHVFED